MAQLAGDKDLLGIREKLKVLYRPSCLASDHREGQILWVPYKMYTNTLNKEDVDINIYDYEQITARLE